MLINHDIALASRVRAASMSRLMATVAALLILPFFILAIIGQVWLRLAFVLIAEVGFIAAIYLCTVERYRPEYAWLVMTSAWFAVLSAVATNGAGMGHVIVLWFSALVCMAGLIGSLAFTYWWALIAFFSLLALLIAEQLGVNFPNITPIHHRYALAALHTFTQLFIIAALVIGYRKSLSRFEATVDRAISEVRAEVAQRKEAEASAKKATNQKIQFIRNVSHEFRTPLNSIIGFSERLLKRVDNDPVGEKALSAINRNGKQLHYFVSELLLLDAIEATDLECNSVSLIAMLEDVVGSLTELARAHDIELQLKSDLSESQAIAYVDIARLSQAFANIILYCIRQSSPGLVHISAGMTGQQLNIVFTDNASALSPSELATLFETHYEHVLNNEKDIPCSAFALKIAALIIGRHNAELQAECSGAHNSLIVTFPLATNAA